MTGLSYQAVLTIGVKLGAIDIYGMGGWTQSFLGDMKIKAGEVELDMESKALVKNQASSSTQADIDPKAKSAGLFFVVGAAYSFNLY